MNQWTYVHGEGDDPLGAPTYVETAYGVKFDPPVSQAEMGKMISKLGTCVRQYVESMVAANEKLKSGIPKDASQKALAGKLLEELLKRHQEETGETFMIRTSSSQTTETTQINTVSEHKTLAEKYGAYSGKMSERDLNRAFLVRCCENHVLEQLKTVTSRNQIRVTLRDLLERANKELPFMTESLASHLLPTLISDGWVLFNLDGETRLLPYGEGVPNYDASKCALDHPMWARDLEIPWIV